MPFYSDFLLGTEILKFNAMSVQEVNHAAFNSPAPAKAQNATVLEGKQIGHSSCLK